MEEQETRLLNGGKASEIIEEESEDGCTGQDLYPGGARPKQYSNVIVDDSPLQNQMQKNKECKFREKIWGFPDRIHDQNSMNYLESETLTIKVGWIYCIIGVDLGLTLFLLTSLKVVIWLSWNWKLRDDVSDFWENWKNAQFLSQRGKSIEFVWIRLSQQVLDFKNHKWRKIRESLLMF